MEPIQLKLGKTFVKGEALAEAMWSVPKGKLLTIEHFSAQIAFGNEIEKVNFIQLGTQIGSVFATHQFDVREQHHQKNGAGGFTVRFVVNQPIRTYATAGTNVTAACNRDIGTSAGAAVTFVATVVGQLQDAP
jgi:hypothetical protein